jgi:5-methylcytosine-specific restriction endonuclease McrA
MTSRNKSNITTLTKEELEDFTKKSENWKELLEKCGYTNFKDNTSVKKKLNEYNINYTHLPIRTMSNITKLTKEELLEFTNDSDNWKELLEKCGYTKFDNIRHVKKLIEEYNIDYSHFDYKPAKKYTLDEIFCKNSEFLQASHLKKYMVRDFNHILECAICKLTEYMGKPIPFEVDHIDGVHSNNKIENLRILCSNCHSQSDTYRGKNRKKIEKKIYKCIDCSKEISRGSLRCIDCLGIFNRKTERPRLEQLKNDLDDLKTYIAVGKKYNVTDNTIRKWIKFYEEK